MELLSQRLQDEIKAFTSGDGNARSLDQAIGTAHELLEKLYILRYKAYETGIYSHQTEVFPEFDLADAMSEQPVQVEETIHVEVPVEPVAEAPESSAGTQAEIPLDLEVIDSTSQASINDAVNPTLVDETPIEPEVDNHEFGNVEPMDLSVIISTAHGKHEKIDKFNGNYSLKEKITFINELFKGSSDSFASAVKQIDSYSTLEDLMPTLNYLSTTNGWSSANRDALEKFIQKVIARYAA